MFRKVRPAEVRAAGHLHILDRLRRIEWARLRDFAASLRGRQLILVAAGLVPTIGLLVYMVVEVRRQQVEDAFQEVLALARVVAQEQAGLIDSTRHLLEALSRLPEVLADDAAACNLLFEDLRRRKPIYNNLATVDGAGVPLCSGIPITEPLSAAGRARFVRAKQSGAFAVGDYQVGKVSGMPAMVAALPVFTEEGDLHRVVLASRSLD